MLIRASQWHLCVQIAAGGKKEAFALKKSVLNKKMIRFFYKKLANISLFLTACLRGKYSVSESKRLSGHCCVGGTLG